MNLYLNKLRACNTYPISILPTMFGTVQLPQKIKYRVEILGTLIKGTKGRLYNTNFLELQKIFFQIFFLKFKKLATYKHTRSTFHIRSQIYNSIFHFLSKLDGP